MALPASGTISMSQVNTEAGLTSTAPLTMTQAFSILVYYPNSNGVNPLSMSELYSAEGVASRNTTVVFVANQSITNFARVKISNGGTGITTTTAAAGWSSTTNIFNNSHLLTGTSTSVSATLTTTGAEFTAPYAVIMKVSVYNRNDNGSHGSLIASQEIANTTPTTNTDSPTVTFLNTSITNSSLYIIYQVGAGTGGVMQ